MWGASIHLAYALQGALTGVLVKLWHGAAPYALKAAALCFAPILATPYTLDYDMMVLAPTIAFLTVDGPARRVGPREKTALAALSLAPLVARNVAQATLIPFGVLAMLATFVLLLRRTTRGSISSLAFSASVIKIGGDANDMAHGHDIAAFKS